MPLFSYFAVFFTCILLTVIAGIFSSICSCYSPYLLSWRAYYVVKSRRMQKILISGQRNRSQDSKTAPEDRNKMALIGFVMWIINLIWTVITGTTVIYLFVMEFFLTNAEADALAEQVDPFLRCFLNMNYLYFMGIMFVFYQLDYSIGKRIYSKKHWNLRSLTAC